MYAVTWHVWHQLRLAFPNSEFCHVPFPANFPGLVAHRTRRLLQLGPGAYFPFSAAALQEAARRVNRAACSNSSALLFRSSTRWAACRPDRPYFVHLDAVFHTYFFNTFRPGSFLDSDLQRIWDLEAEFLENAAGVFFESSWGMEKAKAAYSLRGNHYHAVGVAGGLPYPASTTESARPTRLLSIAKHFRQKGGDLAHQAYQILKPKFSDLTWDIVGGKPDFEAHKCPGVTWHGVLNPERPGDLAKYQQLLHNAGLLIHPTREDMNPLVLMEAAGYGCPAVSVRDFAIPELVKNDETGLLLSRPVTQEKLASAIESLLVNTEKYQRMRTAARARATSNFSWRAVGENISRIISDD